MRILLTNDDGFDSPYLRMLCDAAAAHGHEVIVSAPHTQQSGKSHAFSMGPLRMHERSMAGALRAVSIEGTPVDCSRIGFLKICSQLPDLVISGMNAGWNIGMSTYVSGTCGAAREAAFQGLPALAVSVGCPMPDDTARWFADYAIRTGQKLVAYPRPMMSVCNINCPSVPVEELKDAAICGLSYSQYKDDYDEWVSVRNEHYFIKGHFEQSMDPTPGSDLDLLCHSRISVSFLTPMPCSQDEFADFPVPVR